MARVKLTVKKYTFEKINKNRRRGQKLQPKYWIENIPDYWVDDIGPYSRCGPYASYEEARSDCKGMQTVLDEED